MTSQRDMVRASLLVDAQRETHHDVYGSRRARVSQDPLTRQAACQSIRDLGELLSGAETDQARLWLVLRLRNRLDLLAAVMARGSAT